MLGKLFGRPKGFRQVQTRNYSPEQERLFSSILGEMNQYGGRGFNRLARLAEGDDDTYSAMERPTLNTFNQRLLPEIASRFASTGGLNSSSFQHAATGAAGNLADQLAERRGQHQMGALDRLLGLQDTFLEKRPYNYGLQQKRSKWDKILGILGDVGSIASTGAGIAGSFLGMGGGGAAKSLSMRRASRPQISNHNSSILDNMFNNYAKRFG